MKKGVIFGKTLLAATGAALVVAGCGSSGSSGSSASYKMAGGADYATEAAYDTADYGVYENAMMAPMEEESTTTGTDSSTEVSDKSRKLITTVNLTAETEHFEESLARIENRVKDLGGYIESSNVYNGSGGSYSSRSASLTCRIPAVRLDSFIDSVDGDNNITRKSVNVQDVTLSYVDIESRKNSLRAEEKRLLQILESAETVEDLITVEDKLADVRYELESIESQLRSYDNQVDYSTVYLDINEVVTYTPTEPEGIFTRMGKEFMENLKDVGEGLENLLVYVVGHIPQIVVFVIFVVIVIAIIKLIAAAGKKRQMKRMAKLQKNGYVQYTAPAGGYAQANVNTQSGNPSDNGSAS
ncbi:MAG: DUF4349 domain-containing protein [Butyrivibrio sp.]|nr:DUF4349 domain-containing protein [Butyrivibrio sp.]